MKKLILPALTAAALAAGGCTGVSVHTNLNPSNFTDYFKASGVDVVTYEELDGSNYMLIGGVHGLSCQEDEDDFPANEADARTELKRNAVDMGANALVINKCIRAAETGACSLSVTCYGDALYVKNAD